MLNKKNAKSEKLLIATAYVCLRNLVFIAIAFDDTSELEAFRDFLIEFDASELNIESKFFF